jgi:c-di-GMP-binding flagellar brake protein YcgR
MAGNRYANHLKRYIRMEGPESITGDKIRELLGLLKMERTILKLIILGARNEWLSIVLEAEASNGIPCFVIDFPGGAGDDIMHSKGKKIIIEFTDKDRVHYRLRSVIESVSRQNIYVLMPEAIYRFQRRGYFRVSPMGTKAIINDEEGRHEFDVVNISEGGVLISHPVALYNGREFFKGAMKPLLIVYKDGEDEQMIAINKAEIKRIIKRSEAGCYEYAFAFHDRGKEIEKDIRNFIYSCQRKILYRMKYTEEDQL